MTKGKIEYNHIIGNTKLTDFADTKDAVIQNYVRPIRATKKRQHDSDATIRQWEETK